MKKIFFTCLGILYFTLSLQAQNWGELGTGNQALLANSSKGIYNICTDHFGNVYAAAYDTSEHLFVYEWSGTSWNKLGGANVPPFNGEIFTLSADMGGNIYAGGEFTDSPMYTQSGDRYVAKWDGTSWSQVGNALPEDIFSICFDKHDSMYVAFGGYAAKLVNNTWVELGSGSNALHPNSNLNVICVDTNDNVYVAGAFTDGAVVHDGNLYVAKWDGTSWSELGNGVCAQWDEMDNQIFSMIADKQGNIYVGGILHYGSVSGGGSSYLYYGVCRWNGTAWDVINYGSNTYQFCLDPTGSVYAPLIDTITGDSYVGKWNGTSWNELGTGSAALNCNEGVNTVASDINGNIYAAGFFTDTTVTYAIDTFDLGNIGPPYFAHPCYVAKYTNPASGVTSVNEVVGLSVYPNPTNDEINITTQATGISYSLTSITGAALIRGSLKQGKNNVSLNGFASGIYILEMRDKNNGQVNVVRVVKD